MEVMISPSYEETVREVTYGYTVWHSDQNAKNGTPRLVLRFPDQMKRERVKFILEALDLF